MIGFEGLRVGGLLFGGALAFHKLHGGSLDVSFGFFSLVFVRCGIGNWCGVVIGEGRRLGLTFLCVFSLSCCFPGGGGFYATFLGFLFPFIFPKTKKCRY